MVGKNWKEMHNGTGEDAEMGRLLKQALTEERQREKEWLRHAIALRAGQQLLTYAIAKHPRVRKAQYDLFAFGHSEVLCDTVIAHWARRYVYRLLGCRL